MARTSILSRKAMTLAVAGVAASALVTMTALAQQPAPRPAAQPAPSPATAPTNQAAKPAAKPAAKTAAKAASATAASTGQPSGKSDQAIAILVNDEPITAYEIEQRARFMALSSNIGARAQENFKRIVTAESTNTQLKAILEKTIKENEGKTREQIIAIFEERKKQFALGLQKQALDGARASVIPGMRKQAQEELIEEKLKLQEARKLGAEISEEDANRILKDMAARNKQSPEQFAQNIRNAGADVSTLRARFVANIAWRNVVQRKFSAQISVNQRDVDRMIASSTEAGEDAFELQVQKVTVPLPAKLDQGSMAKGLAEADSMRRKFSGCRNMAQVAASAGAKFEDMKYVRPSTIAEPTRSFLLSAKDGEVLPPQTAAGGVELYAVCSRRTVKADDQKRAKAQDELQSKEYERLAARYLRDLRQDAHIEYR